MVKKLLSKRSPEEIRRIDIIVCSMEQYMELYNCDEDQYEKDLCSVTFDEAYSFLMGALRNLDEVNDPIPARKNRIAMIYVEKLKFWIDFKWNSVASMSKGFIPTA